MSHAMDRKLWAAGAVIVLIVGAGLGWMMLRPGASRSRGPSPEVIAARQERAAALEYPAMGSSPASLKTEYNEPKDRTRMTLGLHGLAASAPGAGLTGSELSLTSEFQGRERRTGELTVRGRLAVVSSLPGVLAPSSPPVVITADGKPLHARAWEEGKSGYSSESKPDGTHESLVFRLSTRDVIRLAAAKSAVIEGGAGVKVALSPAQLNEIREFAARMKPTAP